MDPTKPPHQLLERQRPPGRIERQHLAVEDERRADELVSSRLDDVRQASRDVGEPARPDRHALSVAVELDARAVVLVLERRGAAVSREHLAEILGDLGEHRQERHARLHARRRERRGAAAGGERRHRGEIAEPERRAPRALERRTERARDRLEHEPVGHPRAQLTDHDLLERLALLRRGPGGQGAQ